MRSRFTHLLSEGTDYTVEIARTIDEVESFRSKWQDLQYGQENPTLEADIDYYLSEIETHPGTVEPHVLLLKTQDGRELFLVAYLKKMRFVPQIGYVRVKVFRKVRACLYVVRGGVLGDVSEEMAAILVEELIRLLRDSKVDWIYFFSLFPLDSPLYRLIRTIPGFFCRDHFPSTDVHYVMSLPDSLDKFYLSQSSKTRWRLRRILKKLDEAYPEKVAVRCFKKSSDVAEFCRDAEEVASKTYQRAIKVGFQDTPQKRDSMEEDANHGWICSYILYVDSKPVSFVNGLLYQNTFFTETLGYDPGMGEYRVGTYLFLKIVEDLCREGKVSIFDFGMGSDEYKERFGNKSFEIASIRIFAPTPGGIMMNLVRTGSVLLIVAGRSVSRRMGFYKNLKKWWRGFLKSRRKKSS